MTVQLIILDYCLFYDGTDIMVFCKSKTLSSFEKPVVFVVVLFFFSIKIFFLFVVL